MGYISHIPKDAFSAKKKAIFDQNLNSRTCHKTHLLSKQLIIGLTASMALFVRSGLSVSRRERFECSCCEFMVAKIPGQQLNCYLFVVYRRTSTDDRVFDCLCEAMGNIQSIDPKSVFCFVGDFNCHHSE